jgi:purine-binding chemotaxis protein CheW
MQEKLVVFELNSEPYGVDVTQVQSIIPMQKIVSVPGSPSFVEGVVNLRGMVIPVVDLRHRFELPQPTNGQKNKSVIVIAELDDLLVGLVVDKVTEVIQIPESAIEPPSSLLTASGIDNSYLRGIGKYNGNGSEDAETDESKLVILLDLARVFTLDEQQALAQTA